MNLQDLIGSAKTFPEISSGWFARFQCKWREGNFSEA